MVRPEVTLSERAKPPPRSTAAAPPRAEDVLAIEASLGELHAEQATLLRELIARTPDRDDGDAVEKADYYIRLAELAARTQRVHRMQGAAAEIALATAPPARKPALAAEIAAHKAAADAAVVEVIRTYRTLAGTAAFAAAPHLDTAVFYYAYTLDHAGHADEARAAYAQLIQRFPGSRFVADAYFALADADLEARQLAAAEARYRKVIQLPRSALAHHAAYKLGWVLFAQRKFEDALAQLASVVTATAGAAGAGGDAVLHRAASHDLVRAYAEIGRPDRALALFRRVDGQAPYALLAALGDVYLDQGKYEAAIGVFRQLMHDEPRDPAVCAWQHAVARATLVSGAADAKVHEVEQLVRLYAAIAAPGHAMLPAGAAAECRAAAGEMSGQLARAFHQEAVKTQRVETFALADRLYRAYLGAFGDADDHAETAYFHAELGWAAAELERDPRRAAARWEAVATAFTEVVETGTLSAKLVQVSADAAVQAWMKALAVDPRPATPAPAAPAATAATAATATPPTPPTPATPPPVSAPAPDAAPPVPRPLSPAQRKLLAAYDLYLTHVGDAPGSQDDERVGVTFLKANLLRQADHLAEAIPLFEAIVAAHPEHETAEWAAQLVMDCDNRLGREAAMLAFARGLAPAFLAAHPAVSATVVALQHTAVRREAERLEHEAAQTGRLELYVACGERYLAIYNAETAAADAVELLFDAGVCFEHGKSLGGAIRMYETASRLWPASPVAARALARLGNVYATTAQYREAAERLERYASAYAGEDDAGRALSDAVQMRKGIGDDARAIADTEAFIARFATSRPAEAAAAMFSLTAIYENQRDAEGDRGGGLDRVARHLRAYLDRFGAAGGAGRRVIAWSKLGDVLWRQACPVAPGAMIDGVCARIVREPPARAAARPARCGDDSRSELRVVPRDDRKARAAEAALDHAIAEYEHAGALADDAGGARYHYAAARFGRAEQRYEQYLALALPAGLDFDPRKPAIAKASRRRFDDWMAAKRTLGVALRALYQPLTTLGDGAIAIAAATRIAALEQNAAAQLYRAEIPANLRTGAFADDAAQAYCETLEQVAEPLEAEAIGYYQACLATSTRLGWFSAWSRICERELGRLQPAKFPSALELRPEPTAVATITQLEAAAR